MNEQENGNVEVAPEVAPETTPVEVAPEVAPVEATPDATPEVATEATPVEETATPVEGNNPSESGQA